MMIWVYRRGGGEPNVQFTRIYRRNEELGLPVTTCLTRREGLVADCEIA